MKHRNFSFSLLHHHPTIWNWLNQSPTNINICVSVTPPMKIFCAIVFSLSYSCWNFIFLFHIFGATSFERDCCCELKAIQMQCWKMEKYFSTTLSCVSGREKFIDFFLLVLLHFCDFHQFVLFSKYERNSNANVRHLRIFKFFFYFKFKFVIQSMSQNIIKSNLKLVFFYSFFFGCFLLMVLSIWKKFANNIKCQ